MTSSVESLIIDAQNDFCDWPSAFCPVGARSSQPLKPALPVPGAHADLVRLAGFVQAAQQRQAA